MESSRWKIRPMWWSVVFLLSLWILFIGASLLQATEQRSLTIKDAYAALAILAPAVAVSVYFLRFHYIEVRDEELVQRRWLGLGNRKIPMTSITRITERKGRNFYGGTLRSYRISGSTADLVFNDSYYWPRDLRRLARLLRERGVPIAKRVASDLRLDKESAHWWQ